MNKIITRLLLLFFISASAQVTNSGKPISWKATEIEGLDPIEMPRFGLEALQQEDEANRDRNDIPWRFGYEFFVDHNLQNSGIWNTLPNGDRIWRIRYRSEGAKTMNFLFTDFYMPPSASLYLYNNDHTDLLGAYDAQQNNEQRVLGTWLVKGEDIWLEYYEPAAVAGEGKLEIFKVVHGYRTANEAMDNDLGLENAGDCHYDVDCPIPGIQALKDINKKAVALILVNGSYWCTGALVTNTNNDGKPYFLTANHCYSDPSQWAFRFNWRSPDPVCAGTGPSTSNEPDYYQTVSGAVLRSKFYDSDFCLVEITSQLPALWDLVWAGWDKSDVAPPSTFNIHHPAGDIMKVNRDLDAPIPSIGIYWSIVQWEIGANEGGSSGSPLFDNNGRVIGQLQGGSSACNGVSPNNSGNFFGRFGVSWEGGGTPESRLRDWLDPAATGVVTTDYYIRPHYSVDAELALESIGTAICSSNGFATVTITNTGTDALHNLQLSYTVNSGAPAIATWMGNLPHGESTVFQLPQLHGNPGQNTVVISVLTANGAADMNTSNDSVNGSFDVYMFPTGNVDLELHTDTFPDETSWELQDGNGMVLYSGSNYAASSEFTQAFSLPGEGCYNFIISDTGGDGICCNYGQGFYRLTTGGGTLIAEGGDFDFYDFVSFNLLDGMSVGEDALADIKVFPNPSNGIFNITGAGSPLKFKVYDVLGQVVKTGEISSGSGMLDISAVANGIYTLELTDTLMRRAANFRVVKE